MEPIGTGGTAISVGRGTAVAPRRHVLALAVLLALPSAAPVVRSSADAAVSVIVRETSPATSVAEDAVVRLGGALGRPLGIIGGFVAKVPARALDAMRRNPSMLSVSPDRRVTLRSQTVDGFDPTSAGGWAQSIEAMQAEKMWADGHDGSGVDVALIDSGVSPVAGLAGKVIDGPDLSFESQFDETRYLDTFGHGTHMASLIAGRDANVRPGQEDSDYKNGFVGVAPGARILSVKVATANGAVDVSQVIAAIDWVVQHRNSDGLNVRVLNLSFGTDSTQPYGIDPLAFAVEVAWLRGIVVVAAAGNGGLNETNLNDPAYDPYVIAAAAADTTSGDRKKATTPSWQTRGDVAGRRPDLSAPGRSIVGLRVPQGFADQDVPTARVGSTPRFFKGSGSSQATAFISGAAAVLLSQRPGLNPDQVKMILTSSAFKMPAADAVAQGHGLVDLREAGKMPTPPEAAAAQTWERSTGLGSLDAARGTYYVSEDGVDLRGEQDIFGQAWDGSSWSGRSWSGSSWSGGDWNGSSWSGSSWSGSSWSGRSWSGSSWSGSSWSGRSWSGRSWSGSSWSGSSWSGSSWSGSSWSGSSWRGRSWSGSSWGDTVESPQRVMYRSASSTATPSAERQAEARLTTGQVTPTRWR